MPSLFFVARSQVRRRTRGLIALTIIVGLAGGIAGSLIAGSRRSASVVDRYFRAGIPYTLGVFGQSLSRETVQALPGVVRADPESYVALVKPGTTQGVNGLALDPASIDPTIEVLKGRSLRPGERDPSLLVNQSFVDGFHLGVGRSIELQLFADADRDHVQAGEYQPTGPKFTFHIVGLVRAPTDIARDDVRAPGNAAYGSTNQVLIPWGWYQEHSRDFLTFGTGYDVQLRDPAHGEASFEGALQAAGKGEDGAIQTGPARFTDRRASFNTPVDVETWVLLALGIVLALVSTIVVALLLRAEQRAHSADQPVLTALGTTRTERGAIGVLRVLPVAIGGAALAVALAYALSSHYPVGIGHLLELDRGRRANWAVLGTTALATFLVVTSAAFVLGRRRVPSAPRVGARGNVANWLARSGAPTDLVVGTHLAFQRGNDTGAVPARQAVFGGVVALALVAAVSITVAGIDTLYSNPRAHGWPWDAMIGNVNFTMPKPMLTRLLADPRLEERSRARYGQATVGGRSTEVLVIDPADTAPPVVLSGRVPAAPTEIALGAKLADHLHADIGSKVVFSVKGGELDSGGPTKDLNLRVVGIALPPIIGESEIGETAVVTFDEVKTAGGITDPSFVLARVGGANRDALGPVLQHDYTPEVVYDGVPSRIVNLYHVRRLPMLGALLAALLATVLLVYTLAVSVRTRTRELGVLRAIGMSSRRLGRVLACEGVMLALTMIVIGLPIGIVLGAFSWRTIAHQLGVAEDLTFPIAIALLIPAAITIGLLAALVPAGKIRRNTVASLLRVE